MIYVSMGYYGIKPIYKPMVIMGRDNSMIYITNIILNQMILYRISILPIVNHIL